MNALDQPYVMLSYGQKHTVQGKYKYFYHGHIGMAPAGRGKPASRMAIKSAIVSPPPAESPEITIFLGSVGKSPSPSGG